jgi:hypothetical protein
MYAKDLYLLQAYGPLKIQVGGVFAGVTVASAIVLVYDGTVLQVTLGAIPSAQAMVAAQAWFSVMWQRVHVALAAFRARSLVL